MPLAWRPMLVGNTNNERTGPVTVTLVGEQTKRAGGDGIGGVINIGTVSLHARPPTRQFRLQNARTNTHISRDHRTNHLRLVAVPVVAVPNWWWGCCRLCCTSAGGLVSAARSPPPPSTCNDDEVMLTVGMLSTDPGGGAVVWSGPRVSPPPPP